MKLIKFCEGLGIPNYKFLDWKNLQAAEVANLNWSRKTKTLTIDTLQLLPTVDSFTTTIMQKLWKELTKINRLIYKQTENITDQDIDEFERLVHQWVIKYLTVYYTKEVTPYIHAMHITLVSSCKFMVVYFHLHSKDLKNITM